MTTADTIAQSETKPHALIASDRVEGTAVCRVSGEKIGSIQRLMIDKTSGNVAYAVLRFGGLLGIGVKHLPIPWAKLKFDTSRPTRVSITDRVEPGAVLRSHRVRLGRPQRGNTTHGYYRRSPVGAFTLRARSKPASVWRGRRFAPCAQSEAART